MTTHTAVYTTELPVSAADAFLWHSRSGAFMRLSPPDQQAELLQEADITKEGSIAKIRLKFGPMHQEWVAEHVNIISPDAHPDADTYQFVDRQASGPFTQWEHTHKFINIGTATNPRCRLEDHLSYVLPLGFLGDMGGSIFIKNMLDHMFAYRHQVTLGDLSMMAYLRDTQRRNHPPELPELVGLFGASGLIGGALGPYLRLLGIKTRTFVRKPVPSRNMSFERFWDPSSHVLNAQDIAGLHTVINLAGANIGDGKWTADRKKEIIQSRLESVKTIAAAIQECPEGSRPRVLLNASAVGFYGDQGDKVLTEDSPVGSGFLADVCQQWERATQEIEKLGVRVVCLRIGVVFDKRGGALAKMLPPFLAGAGGPFGKGTQYMSLIGLDDVLDIIIKAMVEDRLSGPVNVVCPDPQPNKAVAETLGSVLNRPALIPTPAFALKAILGSEMAQEMLFFSTRAMPTKLQKMQHSFRMPTVESIIRGALNELLV